MMPEGTTKGELGLCLYTRSTKETHEVWLTVSTTRFTLRFPQNPTVPHCNSRKHHCYQASH